MKKIQTKSGVNMKTVVLFSMFVFSLLVASSDILAKEYVYEEDINEDRISYELQQGERIKNALILANVMTCEASVDGRLGMLAVASVVLTRVDHPRFPNTIEEVVYQRHQFTCVTRGTVHNFEEYGFKQAYYLALDVLDKKVPRVTRATHYYAPAKAKTPFWATKERYLGDIGSHKFYRVYN